MRRAVAPARDFDLPDCRRGCERRLLTPSPVSRRDFDLLGYRYSLLSAVGTGGANLALDMLRRDESIIS